MNFLSLKMATNVIHMGKKINEAEDDDLVVAKKSMLLPGR